jgi:hypothetical protein
MTLNKTFAFHFIFATAFMLTACVGNTPSPETNPQAETPDAAETSTPNATEKPSDVQSQKTRNRAKSIATFTLIRRHSIATV